MYTKIIDYVFFYESIYTILETFCSKCALTVCIVCANIYNIIKINCKLAKAHDLSN